MKEITRSVIAIILVCIALFFVNDYLNKSSGNASNDTITIYNWGEYIDPDLLTQFEEETGYQVMYETFDSNEAMMTKIEQGGTSYDIAVPSEYMIEMMKEKDLLLPLDHSKIPNLKNIDPYFLDLPLIRTINILSLISGEQSGLYIILLYSMVKHLKAGKIYGILL